MAFNPSPEVAAARGYANKFGKDMVIIFHLKETSNGLQLGFSSYGKDKARCSVAKGLGDIAYQAIAEDLAG